MCGWYCRNNSYGCSKSGKVLTDCTGLIDDDEYDQIFKINAFISHFLHIPFPEQLDDDTWALKWAQVKWLMEKGIITPKKAENGL